MQARQTQAPLTQGQHLGKEIQVPADGREGAQKTKCTKVPRDLQRGGGPSMVSRISAKRSVLSPQVASQAYSQPAFGRERPLEASPFLSYILVSELGCS